jgi:hypothetical protein
MLASLPNATGPSAMGSYSLTYFAALSPVASQRSKTGEGQMGKGNNSQKNDKKNKKVKKDAKKPASKTSGKN